MMYTTTKNEQSTKTSLQLFEESGLLGCIESAPDLSTNYKEEISKSIQQKHGQKLKKSEKSKIKHGKKS